MATVFQCLNCLCILLLLVNAQLQDLDQPFDPSMLFDFLKENMTISSDEYVDRNSSILPPTLNETCKLLSTLNKTYHFDCVLDFNHSETWNFVQIRHWIESSDYEFKFDVRCIENSEIALAWPVKSKNIKYISIMGCTIGEFFQDYGNPSIEVLPDHLEVLEVQDSKILIRLKDMMNLVTNFQEVTEEYNCGNDRTLKVLVFKNITYEFEEVDLFNDTSGFSVNEVMSSGNNMIANTRSIDHRCIYKKLERLDQSLSSSKSRYFLSIQTELSAFPELKMMNLSDTGMTDIAKEFKTWWRFFPKMKVVDYSNNFISTIDLDPSANTWPDYNMQMNLTNNKITELTSDDLELLASIPNLFLDIRNNPINCICSRSVRGLLAVVQDQSKWDALGLHRYDYIKDMTCETPSYIKGRKLSDITHSDLKCPVYQASSPVPIIILSVCIVILLVIIIVLTKFRKEIFILTYTRFHIILPCQPAEMADNKKYDAFVSYSNHDEEWVSSTFKDLESSSAESFHQFRFCLHHRDFIPGKTIFDNVIDSVESSRHTVIILSKHFLQSHYCMYEFHEAFQQSIIERKRHMIVVLMENIPEEELPSDLKRCLKTFTYIRKDDSIFTDRLIFAISHKPKKNSKQSNTSITNGQMNDAFSLEKDTVPGIQICHPLPDDSVITLSQIVPDLVVGHNESKSKSYTLA